MSVALAAAPSRLLTCVGCVRCTTPAGSGGSSLSNGKSAVGCVSPSACGSTSTCESLMSAGSGQADAKRGSGTTASSCFIPKSVVSQLIGWPMRRSGERLWSTSVFITATTPRAATHYTSMTAPRHKTRWTPSPQELQWCCVRAGETQLAENEWAWPSSPRSQYGRSVSVMPRKASASNSSRMSWGSTRPLSATLCVGGRGVTWGDAA